MAPPTETRDTSTNTRRRAPTTASRVLLIDDDPQIRELVCKRLEIDGFQIETRPTAEDGVAEYLRAHCSGAPYDIIVLDMFLGAIQGRDVLDIIRSADERCAILMISGASSIDGAITCLELGADDYLGKPLKFWDLKDRLNTALCRRRTIFDRRPGIEDAGMHFGENYGQRARSQPDSPQSGVESLGEETSQASRGPTGEKGLVSRQGERTSGRADRSLDVCDDSRTGETPTLEEHPKGRADSGKSITPSGALIHIVSCLENRYGHPSEGASVSALLSKLGAYVAADLELRPRDLDAVCLAAQSMNLQLACPQRDEAKHRGFTCRFLRALEGTHEELADRLMLAASILEAVDDPKTATEAHVAELASLLLAARDHHLETQVGASPESAAPDAELYASARAAVARLAT